MFKLLVKNIKIENGDKVLERLILFHTDRLNLRRAAFVALCFL
jgi:hypothetical protein